VGWGGWSTLLGPEETGTRMFFCLVLVVFRSPWIEPAWLVGSVGRTGRSCLHTASESSASLFWGGGLGWFGGGVGWCPFVF
jgi:hypothetical protein